MAASTPSGEARRAGERGFALAFLVGVLTVLAIGLAAALPHWAAMAQREKESELIFRGTQYAEGIRVFQRRFGRFPVRLDELVEVEPRSIRQLWKNPIDPAKGWLLLVEVGQGTLVPVDPVTGEVVGTGAGTEPLPEGASAPPAAGGVGVAPGTVVSGNIHGVKSRAGGSAYHVFFGRKDYGEWEFTVDTWTAATGALSPLGLPQRMTAASFGRPFVFAAAAGAEGGTIGGQPAAPPEESGAGSSEK
jgi:type II secretory pathway pseudopilin PulG